MFKCNFICYPRKAYFIIPTIILTIFDKQSIYPSWTIDIRWLKHMFTIAKFDNK